MTDPLTVLWVAPRQHLLGDSPWGPFEQRPAPNPDAAAAALREGPADAMLIALSDNAALASLAHWPALAQAVLDTALVVQVPAPDPAASLTLLQRGVQDVLDAATPPDALARALRLAVERKRLDRAARKAWATDLATGLPSDAQLREHITHLLALREREPAPMALLALRVEGLATTAESLGVEAANVLRRKVAVRLRSGLRASDVVASIGHGSFAVLLAWMDSAEAVHRVADKLAQALRRPYRIAGSEQALAVAVGVASYPADGRDADTLLRMALGQATLAESVGRAGFANRIERGGTGSAANDD